VKTHLTVRSEQETGLRDSPLFLLLFLVPLAIE